MTSCVTDLALERFLLDELDAPAEREHILGCPRCRAALADKQPIGDAYMASPEAKQLAQRLAARPFAAPFPDASAGTIAAQIAAPPRRRSRARIVVALAAVALAATLAAVFWRPAPASTGEAEVLAVQRAWIEAYLHQDGEALDEILADDYKLTDSFGRVSTKADDLASARAKLVHYDAYDTTNVQVRVWGDTAVVTGRSQIRGQRAGRPFAHDITFTDTLARIDGRWRAVAAHVSRTQPP